MTKMKRLDLLKLIYCYRDREVLWNMNSPSYRRMDLKKKAMDEIAMEMDMSPEDVKKKIKALRSTYVAEKRKVEQSKKSGCRGDSVYEPTLFWFYEMSFVDGSIIVRKPTDSSKVESVCSNDMDYERPLRSYEYVNVKSDIPFKRKRDSISAPPEETEITHSPKSATENMLAYAVKHMDKEEDEYYLMAKTYAMKLKKMEPLQRLYADRVINEVLMEGQLGTLERYTSIMNPDAQEQIETSRDMIKDSLSQY